MFIDALARFTARGSPKRFSQWGNQPGNPARPEFRSFTSCVLQCLFKTVGLMDCLIADVYGESLNDHARAGGSTFHRFVGSVLVERPTWNQRGSTKWWQEPKRCLRMRGSEIAKGVLRMRSVRFNLFHAGPCEIDKMFQLVYILKVFCVRCKGYRTAASLRYLINLKPTSYSRVKSGEPRYSLNRMLAERSEEYRRC